MVVLQRFLNIMDNSVAGADTFDLPRLKDCFLKLEFSTDKNIKADLNKVRPLLPFADSEVFQACIAKSRRLTAHGDCKAVYEVTFNVEDSNFKFKAGDTVGVIPHNEKNDVNHIISQLDLTSQADLYYTLSVDSTVKGGRIPAHVPQQSKIRHVLTYCLDIRSVIKKLFLLVLSKYTKDEQERRILEFLCSKQGSSVYISDVVNKGLCILDLFKIFSSCRPPIEVLLANLPKLLPRPYSIVNSGLNNNKTATICFSVMTVNNRKGLTSGWLENFILNTELDLEVQIKNLSISDEGRSKKYVPIYIRKNMSGFSLPEDISKPIIMIGPGTGVAPFLGFLEERVYMKKKYPELKFGEAWMFYGCRNPKLDFLYQDELDSYLSQGVLSKLITAFSRIENTNSKYVQDALILHGEKISKLVKDGAVVYLCGDLKNMAEQVKDIFTNYFVEHDGLIPEEAKAKFTELKNEKRFLIDSWS